VKALEYVLDRNGEKIKIPLEEREVEEIPEKWIGWCKESKKGYTLTLEFVEKIFSKGWIE